LNTHDNSRIESLLVQLLFVNKYITFNMRNKQHSAIFKSIQIVSKIILYQNKWMNIDVLLYLLDKHCNSILSAIGLELTPAIVQRVLNSQHYQCVKSLNTPNKYGIFI
jgi:hypothetical protein